MANKAIYTGPEDAAIPVNIRRNRTPAQLAAWVVNHNEQFGVVETCEECGRGLNRSEVRIHYLTHVTNTRARTVLQMLMDPKGQRAIEEVKRFLDRAVA